eukprot:Opistho-1_new@101485
MGNANRKRELDEFRGKTHFSEKELKLLQQRFHTLGDTTINKAQFRQVIREALSGDWTNATVFLERLFDAFDVNHDHSIDFREFIHGLNIFLKGTPQEKLELSFRMYDIDRNGYIDREELFEIMSNVYKLYYKDDNRDYIRAMVNRIFQDLDVNDDGQLSMTEFKLATLKEPLVLDFLNECLRTPTDTGRSTITS